LPSLDGEESLDERAEAVNIAASYFAGFFARGGKIWAVTTTVFRIIGQASNLRSCFQPVPRERVFMKHVMLSLIILTLTASCDRSNGSRSNGPVEPNHPVSPTQVDDAFILRKMEVNDIPGLSAAIIAKGEVAWAKGYGVRNVDTGAPVTADTSFWMASISKAMTAAALMKAWEDGWLSLDQDVNNYLAFPLDNPRTAGEMITLRHLVTHTSGLKDNGSFYDCSYYVLDGVGQASYLEDHANCTASPLVGLIDYLEAYFVPGGAYYSQTGNFKKSLPGDKDDYSNIAAALAGHIVEPVTGVPLDTYFWRPSATAGSWMGCGS